MARRREFRGGNDDKRNNDDRWRNGYELRQRLDKKKGAVSFFISRIPEKWDSKDFLSEMKKMGPATEAFIISKREKHGLRFGFARFEKEIDVVSTSKALGQLVVDGVRLFAKTARFDRNGSDTTIPPKSIQRSQVWMRLENSNGRRKENVSFVDVVKGNEASSSNTLQQNGDKRGIPEDLVKEKGDTGDSPENINKILQTSEVQQTVEAPNTQDEPDIQKPWFKIDTEDIEDPMENLETRYVAEVKQFQALTCLKNIVLGEDYGYGTVQYLGGFWVLLSFISKEEESKFMQDLNMMSLFKNIEKWKKGFKVQDRLVRLEIEGLPLQAYSPKTIKNIANMHGEVLELVKDNKGGGDLTSGTVCIKTTIQDLIWVSIPILIDNEIVTIRIRESTYYPWDLQGYDKEKGEPESTRKREEGENLEEEEEESERDSDSEGESGDDYYEDSASFLHDGDPDEDLEDSVESKLGRVGGKEDEELHSPSAGTVFGDSMEKLEGGVISSILPSPQKNSVDEGGEKLVQTPNCTEPMQEVEVNRNQSDKRGQQLELAETGVKSIDQKNDSTTDAPQYSDNGEKHSSKEKKKQNHEMDGSGVNLFQELNHSSIAASSYSNTGGHHSKMETTNGTNQATKVGDEYRNQGDKRELHIEGSESSEEFTHVEESLENSFEGADSSKREEDENSNQGDNPNWNAYIDKNGSAGSKQKTHPSGDSTQEKNNSLAATPLYNNTDVNLNRMETQDKDNSFDCRGGNQDQSQFNVKLMQEEENRKLGAGAVSSRMYKPDTEGGDRGVNMSTQSYTCMEVERNKSKRADSKVQKGEHNLDTIIDKKSYNEKGRQQSMVNEESQVDRQVLHQLGSDREVAIKKGERMDELGVSGKVHTQFTPVEKLTHQRNKHEVRQQSFQQIDRPQSNQIKDTEDDQNFMDAEDGGADSSSPNQKEGRLSSLEAFGSEQEEEVEIRKQGDSRVIEMGSSSTAATSNRGTEEYLSRNIIEEDLVLEQKDNLDRDDIKQVQKDKNLQREKAAPVMEKKKRRRRFVDNNLSPIRTRHSTKAEGSKNSNMDGNPLALDSSIRALRKKDREEKGLRIQYPERVLVPIPRGDVDKDSEEIRIGKACGFFKSVKNAESKKGLDYWM